MSCLKGYFKVFAVCALIVPLQVMAQEAQPVIQQGEQVVQPTLPGAEPAGQPSQNTLQVGENVNLGNAPDNSQASQKIILPDGRVAYSERNSSPRVSGVAHEIAEINQRIAVLSARYAEIEMQAKITEKLAEIKKINNPEKQEEKASDTKSVPASVAVQPRVEDIPSMSVREISGVDGDLRATLNLRNGNIQRVKVNDRISGWVVKDIRVDYVEIEKNGKTSKLALGDFTPASSLNRSSASIPPMPPVSLISSSPAPISIQ